jgi:hypothetical protein
MSDHYIENEDQFLKQVEKAARKGAASGSRRSGLFSSILTIVLVIAVFLAAKRLMDPSDLLKREVPVEGHDMTLKNQGFFGYTAADFAEAVLGDSSQMKKLEVYTREVSDAATVTDTGLGRFKVFTKTQILTYHGTVTYMVDLSSLSEKDITVNEEDHKVTIRIPHAEEGEINIPSDRIEFGDVDKGMLAFGKIKLTAEESSKVQTEARNKMAEKLKEDKVSEEADRFAIMSVWEIYHPLIVSVSPAYELEIEFK